MKQYEYKATNLIAEAFEKESLSFDIIKREDSEQVLVPFPIDSGHVVCIQFILRNNDNDIAVRIFGLLTRINESKQGRLIKLCNYLNGKRRHLKFYVDVDGDVNVEYDFLTETTDQNIGEMAVEICGRMFCAIDEDYGVFIKALYTEEDLELEDPFDDIAD